MTVTSTTSVPVLDGAPVLPEVSVPDVQIQKNSRLADLLFGSVAGFTGKLVEYPFDTIKVRLQTQPLATSLADGGAAGIAGAAAAGGGGAGQAAVTFKGPWDCFQHALRTQGILGLYKGLSAPLVGCMIENSALFAAYNHIQNLIRTYTSTPAETPLSLPQLATAGFLSGAFVSLILTPIELVKCRLQVQDVAGPRSVNYKGPLSIITHTLRSDGLKGFYRGHLGTFLREAGGGAAWFGTYE
ncbi:hypothetical protein HK097_002522, partial [Rhizophlyctis rosea]